MEQCGDSLKRSPFFSRNRRPIRPLTGTMTRFLSTSLHWPGCSNSQLWAARHSTIHPGEILVAEDHTGSGHKWRLINDEPWKRAYVVFRQGVDTQFVPDAG